MILSSPAFNHNHPIPPLYTQDGDNISPPLQWSEAPEGTVSYALIVEDPDTPKGVMTHWLVYNMPSVMRGVDREVAVGGHFGTQGLQGTNDMGDMGYDGPKPPTGEHRYIFTLYALDKMLDIEQGATKQDLLAAMQGHILTDAQLIGLYAKHDPVEISKELAEERQEEDAYDLSVHRDLTQPEDGSNEQSLQNLARRKANG